MNQSTLNKVALGCGLAVGQPPAIAPASSIPQSSSQDGCFEHFKAKAIGHCEHLTGRSNQQYKTTHARLRAG